VTELELLQATMFYEVGRRRLLEQTVSNLEDVLAAVRVELAGTQAGEREARHRASHDNLTLLPNAGVFRHRLDDALARPEAPAQPLAVLFLDLDGFKAINEAHGHEIGDAVLRIVAVRLVGGVAAGDLVSRVGGDEFACLFASAPSREQLARVARKLLDLVTSPLKIGPLMLSIRPSIGVALCPADGTSADTLLRRADDAMYRAKRTHTGFAFFDARLDEGDAAHLSPPRFDRLTFTGQPGDGHDGYRAATEVSVANPPPRADTQPQATP
jgi:diguanylate cyclase (GGDEF)-like protein